MNRLGYLAPVVALTLALAAIGCGGDDDDEVAAAAPAAPAALMVSTVGGAAHLTWTDNAADEESYVVERMLHSAGTWETLATLPANSAQHHDAKAIMAGATYMYRVLAIGKGGSESKPSAEVTWVAP